MNAPSVLPPILSAVLLLIAGYSAWRLVVARAWGRQTDVAADALHLAAAVAAAGMISTWARILTPGVWAAIFGAAGLYFAARTVQVWNGTHGPGAAADRAGDANGAADRSLRTRMLAHTAVCAVLVYMQLAGVAPSTLSGSTAGLYTMAGMPGMTRDTTITYPSLGLLCVAALAFYAVYLVNQASPQAPQADTAGTRAAEPLHAPAALGAPNKALNGALSRDPESDVDASGLADDDLDNEFDDLAAAHGAANGLGTLLAPRSAELCRIALVLVMAYAILSKLV